MTPERWQHLKALLHSALEHKVDDRFAFVAEACGDDESLREDLLSLLVHEEQARSFIEQPAFGVMAETLSSDQATSMLGCTLGRYRIIARLGSGGMGEVFVAEDTQLGRKIALKTLPAHFTIDDERVRRFQQEARAASALNHPNIITIYEIGEIDSRHFIVTELIEGETLRQHMRKTQMGISEALDVAAQVASALATAHQAGIVHRDIKPENIMLRADGIAKVLDFGLVKLTERKNITPDSPTLIETAQGMVMGTAHYMSPEQARGLPVDARTDIWSLGVVLFEMVGSRVPFEGATSSDVIASILDREPATLARYSPEVPSELEWIVRKALRKDREERYQTAKELLTDLKGLRHRLEFELELQRSMDSGQKSSAVDRGSWHVSGAAHRAGSQSQQQPSREVIDSLAILPLLNNCADPNMEYLSDGITESMINALSKLTQLRVMAWSTVSRYKNQQVSPREAGRELSVRAVLTGRVMQLGDSLVIKIELVDATDGSHLWGGQNSCKPSDLLDVEAMLSKEISEKLLIRLTTEERKQLTKRTTENVEAYHLYLKGRYFWDKRTAEGFREAIEHFQQAIEKDPNYALAYTGLADTYSLIAKSGVLPPDVVLPKAKAAAAKALEIDDTLAEAHTSLANILFDDWDSAGAERELKRALELKPNYSVARYWYSSFLAVMGRWDQAFAQIEQALEIDPLSLVINGHLLLLFYFARRYDEAIELSLKILKMDSTFVRARLCLGLAYAQRGDFSEAIAALKEAQRFTDTPQVLSTLGVAYALSGKRDKAQTVLAELKAREQRSYFSPFNLAAVYASTGEHDEAFKYLQKACEVRSIELVWLNVNPIFDGMRSDPRFTDILSRIGLPPG